MNYDEIASNQVEREALARASEYVVEQTGCHEVECAIGDVPTSFHFLLSAAVFFGISDDQVRDDIVRMMPKELVERITASIDPLRLELHTWLGDGGQWTEAKSAFDYLLAAFPAKYQTTYAPSEVSDADNVGLQWLIRELGKDKS